MRQLLMAVGGPSTADLLKAIEWGGSSEQPLLVFDLEDGRCIEATAYRIVMVSSEYFVLQLTSSLGDEFEVLWTPRSRTGQCLALQTL